MKKSNPLKKKSFEKKKSTISKNNRFEKKNILITKNKTPFTLYEKTNQPPILFFFSKKYGKHIENNKKLWKENQTLKKTYL